MTRRQFHLVDGELMEKVGGEGAMKIGVKDVEYVARLARLSLSDEEKEEFATQSDDILTYMDKLNEVDTTGVEPTSHVISITNVLRDDNVRESLPPEPSLKNAPEQEGALALSVSLFTSTDAAIGTLRNSCGL